MNISVIGLLALLVVSSGFFINDSFAEVNENSAYLLEGSGYAVTEDQIRISEIDIGLSSHQQSGSSIDFLIEDGFITLDNEDFGLAWPPRVSPISLRGASPILGEKNSSKGLF